MILKANNISNAVQVHRPAYKFTNLQDSNTTSFQVTHRPKCLHSLTAWGKSNTLHPSAVLEYVTRDVLMRLRPGYINTICERLRKRMVISSPCGFVCVMERMDLISAWTTWTDTSLYLTKTIQHPRASQFFWILFCIFPYLSSEPERKESSEAFPRMSRELLL